MNPLINAYQYKINQIQQQISYLLRENNQLRYLLEDAIDPVDNFFPGWNDYGFDKEILKKYITPGGGLTPAGEALRNLWYWLSYVAPSQIQILDKKLYANALKFLARYAFTMTPEQLSSLLQRFGLVGSTADDLLDNLRRFTTQKVYNEWLKAVSETISPGFLQRLFKNRGQRAFTSTRLLAIIAALLAIGWTIEKILEYLDSEEGQNEEWPSGAGEEPTDLDPFAPTATEDPSLVAPSFPSEIPSTTTPPGQSRPELPY
jgi:hypothetical protein